MAKMTHPILFWERSESTHPANLFYDFSKILFRHNFYQQYLGVDRKDVWLEFNPKKIRDLWGGWAHLAYKKGLDE